MLRVTELLAIARIAAFVVLCDSNIFTTTSWINAPRITGIGSDCPPLLVNRAPLQRRNIALTAGYSDHYHMQMYEFQHVKFTTRTLPRLSTHDPTHPTFRFPPTPLPFMRNVTTTCVAFEPGRHPASPCPFSPLSMVPPPALREKASVLFSCFGSELPTD